MAGKKGRSGGPRPNSGGARPGAGRKPKPIATPRVRGSVWMDTRERIFARDENKCRCAACQARIDPLSADEVDHVIPLWEGGQDNDENLQAINAECHKKKSALEAQRRAAVEHVPPAPADDSLAFLRGVMNDLEQDPRLRVRAAICVAQYEHIKKGDGGIKDSKNEAAKKAAAGRFGASPSPPRLIVNNG